MNLIIDLGNTKQKAAILSDNEIIDFFEFNKLTTDDLEFIKSRYNFKKSILSSVVENNQNVKNWLKKNSIFFEMNNNLKLPFNILYKTPKTLGSDRVSAVVGARIFAPTGNLLVIQSGSCITFDFIDNHNNYIGGSISPGIKMKIDALNFFTGRLPIVKLKKIDYFCGSNTEESILAGVIEGTIKEINGMIDNYKHKYMQLNTIITGGAAVYFENKIKNINLYKPNLVIYGLNKILQLND